jgi:hypothetical protein
VRFALSKELLKMKGIFKRLVISFKVPAVSRIKPSLSMTQGPAIKKNGWSSPILKWHNFMRDPNDLRMKRF